MSVRPDVDFLALLAQSGVPTTEQAMEAELKQAVTDAGSLISNDSAMSPFWRMVRAVVVTPALWLIRTLLAGHVLPASFVATATQYYLDLKAWDVNLTRKAAQATAGVIEYTKTDAGAAIVIPASVWVTTERINGVIYRVKPKQDVISPAGEAVARVICEAEAPGAAWNLASGYYAILSAPIDGVLSVHNPEDWITTTGADEEDDDSLALRVRNQFSSVGNYHIDAVYRAMLASVAGVRPDHIFFEHDGPRGPGTANAYVLMEVGATPSQLIDQLNDYVGPQGHHGHGDDLQVFPLPETLHDLHIAVWWRANTGDADKAAARDEVTLRVRAAFRESADYPEMTRTWPAARFSMSQLTTELHEGIAALESLTILEGDIVASQAIPRLNTLEVVDGDA
ncbi:baseplate J/gp47 family protein [Aeromonas enteropelogenes]|uniref:baseplate J/gp47 family protein n=1 Tax=Aeromonas enteropelogenes TaxID=29489 RepID=UPI002286AB48|nr:baseplate J/gp47 family protein [Aeromonas enteropelogenes]